jgi:uncharacterized membrane protein HdeD (DUF308 family)
MLDLRQPSGWFFAIVGIVLIALGVIRPEAHAPMTTTNVNLGAGAAMLVFGVLLLVLAARKARAK